MKKMKKKMSLEFERKIRDINSANARSMQDVKDMADRYKTDKDRCKTDKDRLEKEVERLLAIDRTPAICELVSNDREQLVDANNHLQVEVLDLKAQLSTQGKHIASLSESHTKLSAENAALSDDSNDLQRLLQEAEEKQRTTNDEVSQYRAKSLDAVREMHGQKIEYVFAKQMFQVDKEEMLAKLSPTCVVCLDDSSAEYALVPCGHQCLCHECKGNMKSSKCPMCRETFKSVIRIHKA